MSRRDRREDVALAARCAEGNEAAWRTLVEREREPMVAAARRVVGDAAPDVVDAVIADLWEQRKLARYEGRSSLATWLQAVTAHAALNALRTRAAEGRRDAAGSPSVAVPPPAAGRERELASLLRDAVRLLPARTRAATLLHYEQGLTLETIGALSGRSKATVSRELSAARAAIRAHADRLARERLGRSLETLRADADLERLDLDLRSAYRGLQRSLRGVSNG